MTSKIIPTGSFGENCVILTTDAGRCFVVDPGQDADDIVACLREKGLVPEAILLTHAHFDHIGAIPGVLSAFPNLPVCVHPADVPMFGHPYNCYPPEYPSVAKPADVRDITACDACEVLHTPGHTPGSVCLRFSRADGADLLLSGDTLFAGSCGRTDFPGGSMADMRRSLARLATLAPDTQVIPGHGAATTIGTETATNPFMT